MIQAIFRGVGLFRCMRLCVDVATLAFSIESSYEGVGHHETSQVSRPYDTKPHEP